MFRNIRGSVLGKEVLSDEEIFSLVKETINGTLSMNGEDGYPKAVPMSFIYDGTYFYFHGNKNVGEKKELLAKDPKVCLSIFSVAKDVGSTPLAAHKSLVVYGIAEELDGDDRIEPLKILAMNSGMEFKADMSYINKLINMTTVYRVKPEHMTSRSVVFNAQHGVI